MDSQDTSLFFVPFFFLRQLVYVYVCMCIYMYVLYIHISYIVYLVEFREIVTPGQLLDKLVQESC